MNDGARSPLRLLAPAALVTFAVILALVVTGSDAPDEPANTATQAGERTTERSRRSGRRRRSGRLPQGVYTVRPGDTLAGISEKVGIPVERLQELNPELDPQALGSGQKIKLRE